MSSQLICSDCLGDGVTVSLQHAPIYADWNSSREVSRPCATCGGHGAFSLESAPLVVLVQCLAPSAVLSEIVRRIPEGGWVDAGDNGYDSLPMWARDVYEAFGDRFLEEAGR